MALEDLQSQYGPYNKKGQKGTGEVRDTLANEGTTGLAAGGSKYQTSEKIGVKPRVRFLGWRDDVESLLASCDVFVCPSRHEPLGNVVVEAMACGVPVVAYDIGGPGELVKNGSTGWLVPPNWISISPIYCLSSSPKSYSIVKSALEF